MLLQLYFYLNKLEQYKKNAKIIRISTLYLSYHFIKKLSRNRGGLCVVFL